MASPSVVGFVGLDELCLEVVSSLVESGFRVQAYEVVESGAMMSRFLELGGAKCGSPIEAARDATALILWTNVRLDEIVFGEQGVVKGLRKDAVIINCSTIPQADLQKLDQHLTGAGYAGIVDAHVSRGVSESVKGRSLISASGRPEAMEPAEPILSAMTEKLFIFKGEVGAGSKVRMVNELLEGIHFSVSVEAIFLAVRAGIHPQIAYDIISNAAGSSWIFFNMVPKLLRGDHSIQHSVDTLVGNLGNVMDMAKTLTFPLPILAVAHQQLTSVSSRKYGNGGDFAMQLWEKAFGVNIIDAARSEPYSPQHLADQITVVQSNVKRIGFIGLGAMGFGMATHLLRSKFSVIGFDVYKPTLTRFTDAGGKTGNSPADVSTDVVIIMVANEAQAENLLYGDNGLVPALPAGASIILSSTVSPRFVIQLEQRLQGEQKNLKLVDAPVSGGVRRAADGTLTIMASGTDEALKSTGSVLSALSENLYVIKGGCGAGSSVKMINQLLAGVHIAAAAEAMAFGAQLGLNTRMLFKVLEADLAILDEIDSGLDVDAFQDVAKEVNGLMTPKNSVLLITHYQRLLDFIKPTYVHIMEDGRIVRTGDISLGKLLEKGEYKGISSDEMWTMGASLFDLLNGYPPFHGKTNVQDSSIQVVLFENNGRCKINESVDEEEISSVFSYIILNFFGRMFGNRVPHMLDNDYTPYSAVNIFVKDLGIVMKEGFFLNVPLHISAVAHQQFISGSAAGWGQLDDAAVVKVYEKLTGVRVEGKYAVLSKVDVLNSLPPEWAEDPFAGSHLLECRHSSKVLVVLDDDPTGTQTVHDIEVLTEWNVESLIEQFLKKPICFFILTNSRSLTSEKATLLTKEICRNIDIAAKSVENIGYTVVLRGDSTLRGHFPEEADAAVSVLGEMDAWIICPFFLQGGRYTIDDVHYVADSDRLVPAGETEFSKDASFGYKASNLREWVEEKTRGRIPAKRVVSVSIRLLRKGGPIAVCEHLCSLSKGSICIVNAASERDISVFAAGMIQAEMKGKRFLCRTAASFVSARIGIKFKAPICPDDLGVTKQKSGGLIVVGSYVPKTTKQVEELKSRFGHSLKCIEVSVNKLSMKSLEEREDEISSAAEVANSFVKSGKDTLLMTSRELIMGKCPSESLEINFKVSSALVDIVRRISARPRYILAKGGITSSDLATKALEARRALVVGQALAGIPVWQLGPESRHPGVPYIVFPGNVGDSKALAEVVHTWSHSLRSSSTKDLLLNAEKGGYAVGAFNVYNLEGIQAVVAAAEAEKSPAILQVHPGALKLGGLPLIACCISAAEQASVPITVHFDHGSSRHELVKVLELGFDSLMVDGSHLPFKENMSYTKYVSSLAHSRRMLVEAELGRLSGTEDDLTVEDYEARLTDVTQAEEFIDVTGIDALAVCIGNVHGTYPASGPNLRLDLLKELHALASRKGVNLVLHGASGIQKELIKECIELGIRKFNVNTEVRNAYLESLQKSNQKDLVHVMASAKEAMKAVVAEKMHLFGSAGKA